MCKSTKQGGQRCAAHTRAAYQRALQTFDGTAIRAAAVEYASTPEGRSLLLTEFHDHIAADRFEAAAETNTYLHAGDAMKAANREAATLIGEAVGRAEHRPLTIAVDLDGTTAMGYNEAVHAELVSMGHLHPAAPCDPQTYDLAVAWGIDREAVNQAIIRASAAGITYRHATPDTEGIAAINALAANGVTVKVVTARSVEHGGVQTLQWLAKESGMTYHEVVHAHDKNTVEFDLLVDDAPYNVENLVANGRKAVLIDRAWNRDAPHLPRINSWQDLAGSLKASRDN